MFNDTNTQAIIDFAFSQQSPYDALKSLTRAGRIAEIYRPANQMVESDFKDIFSDSKTRKVEEALVTT